MKNAVIYVRAKTDLSEESLNTIVAQAGQCKAYADDNGFNVVGFYSDISVFGSNRVCIGWEAIVHDPCPFYDCILVYDYGRLGRDIHSVINDLKSLHDRGIMLFRSRVAQMIGVYKIFFRHYRKEKGVSNER